MTEESKKKLAAALIVLGICTAATACGYVDNLSPAEAARLKPAVESLNVKSSMHTNMVLMMKTVPLATPVNKIKSVK